jgi:hypothetical protein
VVQKSCTTWLHSHSVWRQKSSPTIPSSQQQDASEMPAFSSTGFVYPPSSSSWSRRSATSSVVQPPLTPSRAVERPQEHIRVDILLHQVVEELAGVLEGRSQLHCPAGPPPAGAARVAHPLQHGADILNRAAHDHFPHHLPVVAAAVKGYTDP